MNSIAALLILVSGGSLDISAGQIDSTQGLRRHTILFVCEHGSAKSVIAAAQFNDLANKKGLPYRAVARGIHPDKEIPLYVKSGLSAEGLDIQDSQPKPFTEKDVAKADLVITLGCALPAAKSAAAGKVLDWNDVPSPNENYQRASAAIAERVELLLKDLGSKQADRDPANIH